MAPRPVRRRCVEGSWAPLRTAATSVAAAGVLLGERWLGASSASGSRWRGPARACVGVARPWSVAAWNQHRKSSYFQKDCVWITDLQELGNSRDDIMSAVGSLEVQYSPLEIRSFMDGHDVVAIQEADPLFVEALDESFRDRLIRGSDDRDGRGVQVESCSALVIHPDSGIKVVHREQASLGFSCMQGRRVHVCRDVVAVLAERESDGQQLVLGSVHLHPPNYVEGMGRTDYIEYLEPLQRALRNCCKASDEKAPYLVLGDFNLSPEEWAKRTQRHRFWKNFDNVVPEGGETAHRSNPCATGDFAICRGGGSWSGQSFGPAGFGAFERFAKRFTTAAHRKIHLQRAKEACQKALDECSMASAAGSGPEVGEPHHSGFILQDAKDSLQATATGIRRALRRVELTRHRKGLQTSDHRPLSFTGYLGEATLAKEVCN